MEFRELAGYRPARTNGGNGSRENGGGIRNGIEMQVLLQILVESQRQQHDRHTYYNLGLEGNIVDRCSDSYSTQILERLDNIVDFRRLQRHSRGCDPVEVEQLMIDMKNLLESTRIPL